MAESVAYARSLLPGRPARTAAPADDDYRDEKREAQVRAAGDETIRTTVARPTARHRPAAGARTGRIGCATPR
jgi:hypothetical protein